MPRLGTFEQNILNVFLTLSKLRILIASELIHPNIHEPANYYSMSGKTVYNESYVIGSL